jgi:putative salt-induced outer membrane protein YdiY
MHSKQRTFQFHRLLKQIKNSSLLLMLFAINSVANATDIQASMNVSPEQCVAMRQGQSCYVSVQLSWQVDTPGNYCLYTEGESRALSCWENTAKGEIKKSFDSKVNLEFSLRRQNESSSLASAVVKMAWVHKKKGQARKSWRIF